MSTHGPRRRTVLGGVLAVTVLALGLLAAATALSDGDLAYAGRVLTHGDAGTDDVLWKHAVTVPASSGPRAWPENPDCRDVEAALGTDGNADLHLRAGGARALVVVRDGEVICEWYADGVTPDDPLPAFSVSKSLLALLLARAEAEGVIDLDEAITTYVPELAERDARFTAVTLRDLLDMRSGVAFDAEAGFPWLDQDAARVYYASDLRSTVLTRTQIEAPPGSFVYNDYAPNLLGLAYERATGETLDAHALPAFWDELGAEHEARWLVDGEGFPWHESGAVLTARDLARVGQLLLDGGRVDGRQVVPRDTVASALTVKETPPVVDWQVARFSYRGGWWGLDEADGTTAALGRFGQVMVVAPETGVVIVRLGADGYEQVETNAEIALRLTLAARALDAQDERS
ncbi:serine hydrolase domain-containing protein [Myceligenerans indicum]|uniref:Serine hydrolase n=1 Tax=Myceligenerans indicum TaxID=2593663 RepID=A0ABS1LIG0_9MICO|nr:serine hydrolase [Myceligenerans indicum]MBL0885982.1 serine hydrolase [Myceligenerans indicum]